MSTIQLDFAAKDRFELSYKDENGEENGEVFVIHRAPLSTHERFVAFLTEHWIGNFPTWLSPVQVQVITISEKQIEYAAEVKPLWSLPEFVSKLMILMRPSVRKSECIGKCDLLTC